MINKYIKLIAGFILLGISGYLFADRQTGNGTLVMLLALIALFSYLRNEFIMLAFFKMRKEDTKGAKRWLDKIKNPKTALIRSQLAYYYLLNGMIEGENSLTKSESLFRKALNTGLLMNHDKATAKLNLAQTAITKGRKHEAQHLLKEAQKLDKKGLMTERIKEARAHIKKAHVVRNPNLMRIYRNRRKGL